MRLRCSPSLLYEIQIRGFLSLAEVAGEAKVSHQTAYAAVRGDRINMRSAVQLMNAIHRREIRPELAALIKPPVNVEGAA